MLVANWRDSRPALSARDPSCGFCRYLCAARYVRSNGNCCLSDFSTELANGGGGWVLR